VYAPVRAEVSSLVSLRDFLYKNEKLEKVRHCRCLHPPLLPRPTPDDLSQVNTLVAFLSPLLLPTPYTLSSFISQCQRKRGLSPALASAASSALLLPEPPTPHPVKSGIVSLGNGLVRGEWSPKPRVTRSNSVRIPINPTQNHNIYTQNHEDAADSSRRNS
jgi:hypothetical protein